MSAILKYHKIGYHVYADDTQLYISFKFKQPLESISKVNCCLSDIRWWMITKYYLWCSLGIGFRTFKILFVPIAYERDFEIS